MKKILNLCLLTGVILSNTTVLAAADPLNIAGTYKCTGFDSHDGHFTGTVTLSLDEKASDFSHNYGAYQFTLKADVEGTALTYSGFAAAQGSNLAVYFKNDNEKDPVALTDRGVAMAVVSHDQDSNGKFTTTLHKFYYLPEYKRNAKDGKGAGGRGTETCTKLSKG